MARTINPGRRGLNEYYGRYYPSALNRLLARAYLVPWIRNRYYDKTPVGAGG